MKKIAKKLKNKQDLTQQEAGRLLEILLSEDIADEQKAELLKALAVKGESVDEIVGFIQGMRKHMVKLPTVSAAIDTCGTGGDGKYTFNISTTTAFVVAGCGVPVAKHGNRAASSRSGSADVLEALGVNIAMNTEQAHRCLVNIGITFLFAPLYHPAMKQVVPARKLLGAPTIFNLLGPFLNPAGVKKQLLGVSSIENRNKLAVVAKKLNYTRLVIAVSDDGLDEVSPAATTQVLVIEGESERYMCIDPIVFGLQHNLISIIGGDAQQNAHILIQVLAGKKGSHRDTVLLNSAAALFAAKKATTIEKGIEMARTSIDSGKAQGKLKQLLAMSNR